MHAATPLIMTSPSHPALRTARAIGRVKTERSMPLTHSHLRALVLISATLLTLAGCKERTYPTYRENPTPKNAIPIRIKVTDAPVDVPVPKVLVQYQIDLLCLPPISNYAGVHLEPKTHWIEYPVQRVSDTEFRSVVFEDGMQVADYYGHGLCSWTMPLVQAAFPFQIGSRPIVAAAGGMTRDLTSQGLQRTYVERALTPLSRLQPSGAAYTLSSTLYDKLPQTERSRYFAVDVFVPTEEEHQ